MSKDISKRTDYFTEDDVIDNSKYSGEFTGKILVLHPYFVERFTPPYQTPQHQLLYAIGGFGCDPDTIGSAVVCKFVSDGEVVRYSRNDFFGILKPEIVKEYKLDEWIKKHG